MDIRIFSFNNFEYKGLLARFERFEYEEYFYKPGTFSFSLPVDFLEGMRIEENDVVIFGSYAGIIKSMHFEDGEVNRVEFVGTDLLGLLKQRLIIPTDYTSTDGTAGYDAVTGDTESIIHYYINKNLINPAQTYRKIPGITLAANQHRGVANDKYMARFEQLDETVTKLAADAKLGVRVSPQIDGGLYLMQFVIDCKIGADRTANQEVNPSIIFDIGNDAAQTMAYNLDIAEMRNAFYSTRSGAEFVDEALTMLYYRDDQRTDGVDRQEMHLNVSADTPEAGKEYAELKRQAQQIMKDYEIVENVELEANNLRHRYGIDYHLGDFVTISNRDWGIVQDMQVVGMRYEVDGQTELYRPIFGTEKSNIIKKIRKEIKNR